MSSDPAFRSDLYRGTAAYYDRFRLSYPAALVDDLCRRASVSGSGRLLDLACGPGTLTLPLSKRFAEVWAVDQEPEVIDFAFRKSEGMGVRNVRWMVGRAEDVDLDEVFELVTIGTAFHWLDRRRVATRAMRWLRSGGHLALLWSANPLSGTGPWHEVLYEVVHDWMHRVGAADRALTDLQEDLAQTPHATVLEEAGFDFVGRYEFEVPHAWNMKELIGFVYSTSLLPVSVLGSWSTAFERDLEQRLRAIEPSGVFAERVSFAYDLARRPHAIDAGSNGT